MKLLIRGIWIIICKKFSRVISIIFKHLCQSPWFRLFFLRRFLCGITLSIGEARVVLVNCICYKESIKEIVTGLPLKHCLNGRKNRFGWGSQRAHPKPQTQDSFIKLNVSLKKSGSTKDSFIKLNVTLKKSGSTKDSFIKLNVTLKKSGSTKDSFINST